MVVFNPEQAKQFLQAIEGDRLEGLFVVAATLGLREGEAIAIQIDDVDLAAGTLTVRASLQRVEKKLARVETKSDAGRRCIALPAVTISALGRHLQRREEQKHWAGSRWQETGYLFTSTIGTPVEPRSVVRRFHALLKLAGLPRMRVHDLRHSTATLLLAQGVPPKYIADLLGHSQVAFTMQTYAHVLPQVRKQVAAKMDEILAPVAPENGVATSVATKPASDQVN
jgi:integrase